MLSQALSRTGSRLFASADTSRPRTTIDMTLLWCVVLMLAIGFVMVYSASIAMSEAEKMTGYRSTYFMMRHAIYLTIGVVGALIVFQIPMQLWQR
ncbi:MAG: FtsW/RodA/SpoVE family cell cycle protein, partial [Burkholderiales bacterium]